MSLDITQGGLDNNKVTYPDYVYGDNLTPEDAANGFSPWDVSDEAFLQWREANSCPCIRAGRPCDGTCIEGNQS